MATNLHSQDAKPGLGAVEGDALDQPREGFPIFGCMVGGHVIHDALSLVTTPGLHPWSEIATRIRGLLRHGKRTDRKYTGQGASDMKDVQFTL